MCEQCKHPFRHHGIAKVIVYGREAITISCDDCPRGLCGGS